MSEGKVMNRWLVVVGAILIQLCLGAIYAWSVFTPRLTADRPYKLAALYNAKQMQIGAEEMGRLSSELAEPRKEYRTLAAERKVADEATAAALDQKLRDIEVRMDSIVKQQVPEDNLARLMYGFSAQQAAWIFSVGLASFAVVMVLAGRMLPKVGPRALAVAGGFVLGAGYVLGGMFGHGFVSQLLCIGLIGGAGIGLGYVVPIKVGIAWFPDKKGMVSGLAVAGFGFGATIWVKLAGSWFGGMLNTTSLLGLPGVQSVFVIYGIAFVVLVLLGSVWMVNPPDGYKPSGWEPPATPEAAKADGAVELTSGAMLRTPQYYMLFLMFIGSALAGLMVIYCIRLFGIDALVASGAAPDAVIAGTVAGTAMAWYAILNGLGRIAWGSVSDKIGRKMALFLMCLLQGVIMLLFYKMGASRLGLIIGACIIGFNFGGNFALFPVATADFFGNKNVGTNYGWVFLAYGVAGIAGPQVAGYFKDAAVGGDVTAWLTPFVIAGIACLLAAVIGLSLRAPRVEQAAG